MGIAIKIKWDVSTQQIPAETLGYLLNELFSPSLSSSVPCSPPPSPLCRLLSCPLALSLPLSFLPLNSVSLSHNAQQWALPWAFLMPRLHNTAAQTLAELSLVWLCCDQPHGPHNRPLPVCPRLWSPDQTWWNGSSTTTNWTRWSWGPKVHTEKLGSLALFHQPDDPLQSEPHYNKTLL